MKKYLVLLVLSATLSAPLFAQHKEEKEEKNEVSVPAVVKKAFARQYPGIHPGWEAEGKNFEAGFKKNGKEMSALFDARGKLLESEMEIPVGQLPAAAASYVKTHYKGQRIREAAKITGADGSIRYEAEIAGKDVLFDSNGNFIKEARD